MGHVVIGTSVCLRFCFLLTLTGLVIIWTSSMFVSVSRAFGTNRNHVGLYWKCSAGRWGVEEERGGGWEGEVCQSVRDCVSRNVDCPLKNNSSIFNACLQQTFNFVSSIYFPTSRVNSKLLNIQVSYFVSLIILINYKGEEWVGESRSINNNHSIISQYWTGIQLVTNLKE